MCASPPTMTAQRVRVDRWSARGGGAGPSRSGVALPIAHTPRTYVDCWDTRERPWSARWTSLVGHRALVESVDSSVRVIGRTAVLDSPSIQPAPAAPTRDEPARHPRRRAPSSSARHACSGSPRRSTGSRSSQRRRGCRVVTADRRTRSRPARGVAAKRLAAARAACQELVDTFPDTTAATGEAPPRPTPVSVTETDRSSTPRASVRADGKGP